MEEIERASNFKNAATIVEVDPIPTSVLQAKQPNINIEVKVDPANIVQTALKSFQAQKKEAET